MGGMKDTLGDTLFDNRAFARTSDPVTSHTAAASVKVTNLERQVLDSLLSAGPATSHELAERLNMSLVTVSPRLRPLADKCMIWDSGERRINASGRSGIVWTARKGTNG